MRRRFDLTDCEWSVIAPLLPQKNRGVSRGDDRRVINGIVWRLYLPERYGPYTTCYNRFVRWRRAGTSLLADRGYDTDAIRDKAAPAKAFANIPAKRNRTKSFAFSAFLYRYRNLVERSSIVSNMLAVS